MSGKLCSRKYKKQSLNKSERLSITRKDDDFDIIDKSSSSSDESELGTGTGRNSPIRNYLRAKTSVEQEGTAFSEPCVLAEDEEIGEIGDLFRRFKIVKKVCTGQFATVYLVKDRQNEEWYREIRDQKDNQELALKVVRKNTYHRNETIPSSPRSNIEAIIHLNLNHENIIRMFEYHEDYYYQMFLLEFAPVDLFEKIRTSKLSNHTIKRYTKQITEALQYCHKNGIIHRDIKSENILISSDDKAKLCDFGLSTRNKVSTRRCGTVEYMAPEMILGWNYNYTVDLWSLGILLYEMYYLDTPFSKNTFETEVLQNIVYRELDFPENNFHKRKIPVHAKNLIKKLLHKNPMMRPSYKEIYQHRFIESLDETDLDEFRLIRPNELITKLAESRTTLPEVKIRSEF